MLRPSSFLPMAIARRKTKNSCATQHRAYFLAKLKDWKEAIVEESRATMAQLQVDSLREPDIADRASSETDWSIELRTRDRQRKLIAKIDCAIRRLYEGEYGYCEVTGEPISLAPARSPADRDHDARSAGAPRADRARLARRLNARIAARTARSLAQPVRRNKSG